MNEALQRRSSSPPWFLRPWVIIAAAALIGVPAVFLGLVGFGLAVVNPVTWFLVGAAWFAAGFRDYRHKLTIRDTPLSKIDAAAIGLVEVSGRVVSNTTENAPVSGEPCVYWKVSYSARNENAHTNGVHHSPSIPFGIDDDSARVLIWPWKSELMLMNSRKWKGKEAVERTTSLIPGPLRDSLHHILRDNWQQVEITEEKIEVGARLYVMGTLSERRNVAQKRSLMERIQSDFRGPSPGIAPRPPTLTNAVKVFALAIAMVVGGLATGKFLSLPGAEPQEQPPEMEPHQLLIWRGESDRPFIIADKTEGIVIQTLTRSTKIALVGGAGVMTGTLILLLGGFFSS